MTFSTRPRKARNTQFLNTMQIIAVLLEIELDCISAVDERFVPVDEILARALQITCDAPQPMAVPV